MNRTFRATAHAVRIAALAAIVGAAPMARAGSASSSFNVTATVQPSCAVSATNVAFGNYSATQVDATGTISVACTNLALYTVQLDTGTGSGASVATRRMTGPSSQTLDYTLYQDSARLLLWGSTIGVNAPGGTGTGSTQTLTVYGRIPAGQYPGAGSYSDTVTVTVAY